MVIGITFLLTHFSNQNKIWTFAIWMNNLVNDQPNTTFPKLRSPLIVITFRVHISVSKVSLAVQNSRSTCVPFFSTYFCSTMGPEWAPVTTSRTRQASLQFNFYGCQFSVLLSEPGPIASYTYIATVLGTAVLHYRRIFLFK